jgi:hypothetical protein
MHQVWAAHAVPFMIKNLFKNKTVFTSGRGCYITVTPILFFRLGMAVTCHWLHVQVLVY